MGVDKCVCVCVCMCICKEEGLSMLAPLLFMFGNLRNKVKGGERERERMETDRGGEFTLPLCAAQSDTWLRYITMMKI